jgi:hypothetical protein
MSRDPSREQYSRPYTIRDSSVGEGEMERCSRRQSRRLAQWRPRWCWGMTGRELRKALGTRR